MEGGFESAERFGMIKDQVLKKKAR